MGLPFTTIEQFVHALDRLERPLAVLAHHDDEVSLAGILSRVADRLRLVWVTNSDGLYFQTQLPPKDYGTLRKAEGLHSAAILGLVAARTECLDYSEVEIYRRLSYITQDAATMIRLRPFFSDIARDVRERIFAYRPEVVFTCGFQGGNPEHDLTHYFTRLALDEYRRDTGLEVPLIQAPMYEYVILISQRFNPFYRGIRWKYRLSEAELAVKLQVIDCYRSQLPLFNEFRTLGKWLGPIGYLTRGHKLTVEEYLSEEAFGPMDPGCDYLRNPHTFDRANYIFDHFAGIPVSFDKSIRPIIAAFPRPL